MSAWTFCMFVLLISCCWTTSSSSTRLFDGIATAGIRGVLPPPAPPLAPKTTRQLAPTDSSSRPLPPPLDNDVVMTPGPPPPNVDAVRVEEKYVKTEKLDGKKTSTVLPTAVRQTVDPLQSIPVPIFPYAVPNYRPMTNFLNAMRGPMQSGVLQVAGGLQDSLRYSVGPLLDRNISPTQMELAAEAVVVAHEAPEEVTSNKDSLSAKQSGGVAEHTPAVHTPMHQGATPAGAAVLDAVRDARASLGSALSVLSPPAAGDRAAAGGGGGMLPRLSAPILSSIGVGSIGQHLLSPLQTSSEPLNNLINAAASTVVANPPPLSPLYVVINEVPLSSDEYASPVQYVHLADAAFVQTRSKKEEEEEMVAVAAKKEEQHDQTTATAVASEEQQDQTTATAVASEEQQDQTTATATAEAAEAPIALSPGFDFMTASEDEAVQEGERIAMALAERESYNVDNPADMEKLTNDIHNILTFSQVAPNNRRLNSGGIQSFDSHPPSYHPPLRRRQLSPAPATAAASPLDKSTTTLTPANSMIDHIVNAPVSGILSTVEHSLNRGMPGALSDVRGTIHSVFPFVQPGAVAPPPLLLATEHREASQTAEPGYVSGHLLKAPMPTVADLRENVVEKLLKLRTGTADLPLGVVMPRSHPVEHSNASGPENVVTTEAERVAIKLMNRKDLYDFTKEETVERMISHVQNILRGVGQ
eukprot:GHVS01051556.1.p1 GENE.GHVS01051556.1~~GHVS01051556.1.p1  ORF type:complete len:700 (+),score=156.13 GHVS01051556.1:556-2655(+)